MSWSGEVLTAMLSNKAPGYDRIPLFVIKDCLPYILPILTRLMNSSFACSKFPRVWKKSVIVPHLKDGDHEVPNNNRPISLLPVFSKVAEKIALIQFNDFLTKQDKLTQHQSGNRKNHSTETLSLLVADHIFRAIDQQQLTAMVLIELSKAFDSICHSTLLLKLRSLGTSSQALKWFESYLTNRKQSTRLGTSLSDELTITHMSHCWVVLLTPITDKSKQNQTHFFRDKAAPKQGIRHQGLSSTKDSLRYPQLRT